MVARAGALLIVLSCLLWVAVPVVPLLPGTAAERLWRAGVVYVASHATWWVGLAMVGSEAWRVARSRGWRHLPSALLELLRHGRVG